MLAFLGELLLELIAWIYAKLSQPGMIAEDGPVSNAGKTTTAPASADELKIRL